MSETYQPGSSLRFRGRTYLLFKRGEGTSYSLRIQHQGKRRILATGHADLTLAKAKADPKAGTSALVVADELLIEGGMGALAGGKGAALAYRITNGSPVTVVESQVR